MNDENRQKWKKFENFFIDLRQGSHSADFRHEFHEKVKNFLKTKIKEDWGRRNLWIVKPCVSSRGRGIKVHNSLSSLMQHVQVGHNTNKQQYNRF